MNSLYNQIDDNDLRMKLGSNYKLFKKDKKNKNLGIHFDFYAYIKIRYNFKSFFESDNFFNDEKKRFV